MTNPSRGSSLLQARGMHSHAHSSHRLRHLHADEGDVLQQHQHQEHQQNQRQDSQSQQPDQDFARRQTEKKEDDGQELHDQSIPSLDIVLTPNSFNKDDDDAVAINALEGKKTLQENNKRAIPAVEHGIHVVDYSPAALVTQVIQTVSLVQIVNTLGSPIAIETRLSPPNTVVVDSGSGKTVSQSNATSSIPLPGSSPQPTSSVITSSYAGNSNASTQTPVISTSSYPASVTPSIPLSTFPSLSDGYNSTRVPTAHNGTTSQLYVTVKNATLSTITPSSTYSHSSTSLSTSISDWFTDQGISVVSQSQTTTTTTTDFSTATVTAIVAGGGSNGGCGGGGGGGSAGGGGDGGGSNNAAGDSSSSTPSAPPNPTDGNLTPQQKQVIGGVVGGVAGAAFFALLVMLVLRYKRRRDNRGFIGGSTTGGTSRGLPSGPNQEPIHGNKEAGVTGGIGAMAERYGPAAITAAIAGFAGRKSNSTTASDGGERGFYRVSGRKLPSVLHAGGDGYTDPREQRESVMSDASDYYRGSQAFDVAAGTRLAVGTPMRPVSGVPIMRTGPARVPVTERNPFADPPPKTPPGDGYGPTLSVPRESPRGSGSRFQERID